MIFLYLSLSLGGCSSAGEHSEISEGALFPTDSDIPDVSDADESSEPPGTTGDVIDVEDETDSRPGNSIVPGSSIGPIELGLTYEELRESFGEIPQAFGFRRLYIVPYPELNLEIVYASGSDTGLSDDAWVMALGTDAIDVFEGPVRPGMTRLEVEEAYGVAPEEARGHAFYPSGVSVRYEDEIVVKVGVFEPFTIRLSPPPMEHAEIVGAQQ